MLRVLSILYSTYFYFYLLYTLIVIYERYVKKEYNRFPNNLKSFNKSFSKCSVIVYVRTDLILLVSLKRLLLVPIDYGHVCPS